MHDINKKCIKRRTCFFDTLFKIWYFFHRSQVLKQKFQCKILQDVYSQSTRSDITCKLEYHLQHWNHVSKFSKQNNNTYMLKTNSIYTLYVQNVNHEWMSFGHCWIFRFSILFQHVRSCLKYFQNVVDNFLSSMRIIKWQIRSMREYWSPKIMMLNKRFVPK